MIITPLLITLIAVVILNAVVHAASEGEFYRVQEQDAHEKALAHRHRHHINVTMCNSSLDG